MKNYIVEVFLKVILLLILVNLSSCKSKESKYHQVQVEEKLINLDAICVRGILGEAIYSNENGRIKKLPDLENGQLIKMFSQQAKQNNKMLDWYGEHGGKWLYMAAKAAKRTQDEELKKLLFRTADFLVSTQEGDGYIGTYSSAQRFTSDKPKSHKWSWDVWNSSYMILGLLEVNKYFPNEKYKNAAKKIGELFMETFGIGKKSITKYGTRYGMSATVILDPIVELYKVTKDPIYLEFAEYVISAIEAEDELRIISKAIKNRDMATVGDGKSYQLVWNLTAILKLYRYTSNSNYLQAVKNAWQNIVAEHLTITGGPWGGIGQHYEIFNRKGYWSPYGFVETCSIMAWLQLNRELLITTGEVKYADQIEKTVYNALLGAQYPNGEEWCYHSFTNGKRHVAEYNDCCPSSGAISLEEISPLVYTLKDGGIACNLYTSSDLNITLNEISVQIVQETEYPNEGKILLKIKTKKSSSFPLYIRIPEWANNYSILINGQILDIVVNQDGYAKIFRKWEDNDEIVLNVPMKFQVHQKLEHIPKYGKDISSVEWFAIKRGPLVYSVDGLLFGKQRESVVDIPLDELKLKLESFNKENLNSDHSIELKVSKNKSLRYLPFYLAGGRESGAWRLTWVQNKIN